MTCGYYSGALLTCYLLAFILFSKFLVVTGVLFCFGCALLSPFYGVTCLLLVVGLLLLLP